MNQYCLSNAAGGTTTSAASPSTTAPAAGGGQGTLTASASSPTGGGSAGSSGSANNGNSESSSSGGLSTGATVGIIVGAIAGVTVIAFGAVIFSLMKKRQKRQAADAQQEHQQGAHPRETGVPMKSVVEDTVRTVSPISPATIQPVSPPVFGQQPWSGHELGTHPVAVAPAGYELATGQHGARGAPPQEMGVGQHRPYELWNEGPPSWTPELQQKDSPRYGAKT